MFAKYAVSAVAFSAGLLLTPGVAVYASGVDSVTIGSVAVSGCGEQSLTFNGTATYSEPTQHLVVDLDGTELLHLDREDAPATWTTGAVTVGVGNHTLTATIYGHSDHEDPVANHAVAFAVDSCAAPPSGGLGESQDCCPGPDPVEPQPAPVKGRVKAAVGRPATLPAKLMPLNEIFRKVYGRSPTFEEWSYWAGRLLNDKPQYDALYGAMQWHQRLGHTMMPPRTT